MYCFLISVETGSILLQSSATNHNLQIKYANNFWILSSGWQNKANVGNEKEAYWVTDFPDCSHNFILRIPTNKLDTHNYLLQLLQEQIIFNTCYIVGTTSVV
jgi:hypothetical protein